MLSNNEFEMLLNSPESSVLDFKKEMYKIADDKDHNNRASFIKDVICFSNTIRNENAYIIVGVEEHKNGTKVFVGLNDNIDDSIFQEIIKDKVFPKPKFEYFTIRFNNKIFGIFKFPVVKYSSPIYPVIKMKGLDVGRMYFRRNTSNSEAIGHEIIQINNWLNSLPESTESNNLQRKISSLLTQITSGKMPLSTYITVALNISRDYKLVNLTKFCVEELQGLDAAKKGSLNQEEFKYRSRKIILSIDAYEIDPYGSLSNSYQIRKELMKCEGVYETFFLFVYPIARIEEYVDRLKKNPNQYAILKVPANRLIETKATANLTAYLFEDDMLYLYSSIRQKLIDELIAI